MGEETVDIENPPFDLGKVDKFHQLGCQFADDVDTTTGWWF